MNILWIARTCPYPPHDGERIRIFNLLRQLAPLHQITFVCRTMSSADVDGISVLKGLGINAIGVHIPPPRGFLQRIKMILPFLISRYPISLCTVYYREVVLAIQSVLKTLSFDIVQVEHSSLSIYLDYVFFPTNPVRLLTLHNIDYLRFERIIANSVFSLTKLYLLMNQRKYKRWELDSFLKFDRIMVMSRYDAMLLKGQGVNATIDVVPNGVDCNRIGYGPPTGQGSCVLFVASLDSDANHDGAIYFLREILPLISLHTPEVIARIVGRNPRSELLNSGDGRHVFVHANVDDVLTYYRNADVIVVPLRSGGGTRLKILEAMAAGVPVVSTSIGAEGLDIVSGENILLADTPVDFAARVVELLSNVEMARTISLSARNLVESIYDWRRIAAAQDAVYHQERNND